MEREAFERALAYHCAPALVGLRCACVISLSSADYPALPRVAGRYTRLLERRGVRIEVLCRCESRWLLLVYRPELLEAHLQGREAVSLLQRRGYPTGAGLAALLRHLRRRLLWREGFPHEIGLFLGYPPEDVQGFLADPGGGRCKLCGHWKVYHDVEGARRQFARFDRSREALCSRLRAGMALSQLFGVRETPAA